LTMRFSRLLEDWSTAVHCMYHGSLWSYDPYSSIQNCQTNCGISPAGCQCALHARQQASIEVCSFHGPACTDILFKDNFTAAACPADLYTKVLATQKSAPGLTVS